MLRDRLGVKAFAEGPRLLWRRFRFRIADWEQLREAFDEVGGGDLAADFDQWLRRPGAPGLRLVEDMAFREGDRHGVSSTLSQGG
jgi:aminopeptidase N